LLQEPRRCISDPLLLRKRKVRASRDESAGLAGLQEGFFSKEKEACSSRTSRLPEHTLSSCDTSRLAAGVTSTGMGLRMLAEAMMPTET